MADSDEHTLSPSALEGVDLPRATLDALASTGVPRELRLPAWPGPTIFSSELGNGRLGTTSGPDAAIRREGATAGYVLGAVRDTQDTARAAYSYFVLREGTGEVWLVDADDPSNDRFVNRDVVTFLASMDAFHTAWPRLVAPQAERETFVASFRGLLERLDARALSDPENYWPGWLDELE